MSDKHVIIYNENKEVLESINVTDRVANNFGVVEVIRLSEYEELQECNDELIQGLNDIIKKLKEEIDQDFVDKRISNFLKKCRILQEIKLKIKNEKFTEFIRSNMQDCNACNMPNGSVIVAIRTGQGRF